MKTKSTLFLLVLIFATAISRAQSIPNADFENWTDMGTYENPNLWYSFNDEFAFLGLFSCEKGSPGSKGNYFLKLTNIEIDGETLPGMLFSSSSSTMDEPTGFPVNSRPKYLNGKFQYSITRKDTAAIMVYFSKWNSGTMSSDMIGFGTLYLGAGTKNSWTNFSIPVTYFGGTVPDTAIIVINAGANENWDNIVAGNYLYIDDLEFSDQMPVGIDISKTPEFAVYPNPATGIITVDGNFTSSEPFTVISALGETLMSGEISSLNRQIDLSNLNPNPYFLRIGNRIVKIIKTE